MSRIFQPSLFHQPIFIDFTCTACSNSSRGMLDCAPSRSSRRNCLSLIEAIQSQSVIDIAHASSCKAYARTRVSGCRCGPAVISEIRPLVVRALCAWASILLLINLYGELIGVALVRSKCFKNQILCISMSYVLTTIFIIYMLDIIDSLGNYICW